MEEPEKKTDSTGSRQARDHRELGQLLDLFSFHDIAPGAAFWHPNGMTIFRVLEQAARQMNDRAGYKEISTPIMVRSDVFKKSGHWEHYRKNMFHFVNPTDENEELAIKPMNCPESTYVFNASTRSYRDMPLRFAELGRLHRNELSGTLGGLFRVRQMTMDDAHVYCRPDQVEGEVRHIIDLTSRFYAVFGFKPTCVLATRPEKFMGDAADWDKAEAALKSALNAAGMKYELQEGEGAFYGPKIEFHLRDSQDRDWQMGTAQLDLVMLPKQFETQYVDEDGSKKMPWVIHRAIFGTFERFIGMMLEHTDGTLPIWLAPVQATVLYVNDSQRPYAEEVCAALVAAGVRAELDTQNATLGKKIRAAEVLRIPVIAVIGEKEVTARTVSVRNDVKPFDDFIPDTAKAARIPQI
ncbi:MAG: threonine--tRNA ligase [bacterium]|nr:threonine--tRNA ligase [bacterium]